MSVKGFRAGARKPHTTMCVVFGMHYKGIGKELMINAVKTYSRVHKFQSPSSCASNSSLVIYKKENINKEIPPLLRWGPCQPWISLTAVLHVPVHQDQHQKSSINNNNNHCDEHTPLFSLTILCFLLGFECAFFITLFCLACNSG